MLLAILLVAEVTLGSWNLKWFPSGRAEHRASPRVEQANFEDAAELIVGGIKSGGHILFFQELRDAKTATNLVTRIGKRFMPAVTTAFKMGDNRLGWQQCAIVTDLPVVESRWAYWRKAGNRSAQPPRGYAYALVDAGEDGLIACYCVHLKSNYGATDDGLREKNATKREGSAEELVEIVKAAKSPDGRRIAGFVIAGDFNTDPFSGEFENERTIALLEAAGFVNCFSGLPIEKRGTHPGNKTYPDSTIDFILPKGLKIVGAPKMSKSIPLSDHRMIWLSVR